jgi:hypothetical protein
MTTYVYRDGEMVEKSQARKTPGTYVSRFESYESPIDGKTISSDRQRERDLYRSNSFDTRDYPKDHQWRRGRDAQLREKADASRRNDRQLDFWR